MTQPSGFESLNKNLVYLGALDYFLGIEAKTQSDGSLILTQSKYIRDLLKCTDMEGAKSISSPMVSGCKLSKIGSEQFLDASLYRSIIGALQYATIPRPEISNLQCGESVTIEGQAYTISAVTHRYQLRKGKYEPSEKRLDVLSTGRYLVNLYLENLLEQS
uniref:Reverse transcriptase Ty1/copia-type domain-containing protein n=1 Tax=Cajanus cajan TaxID=3821 RepID=A0A151RGD9_CAJCA|nr:hypothetical protein KK1_036934 [Cajanus cajan]